MSAPPTGVLFYEARAKPLSTVGLIQPGAYYQFYLTGTTTLTNVYADGSLTTPLSQTPGTGATTAASDGRLVPIYLNPATTYRYQLYSSTGTLLEDVDPYIPVSVPTQAQIGQVLYPQTAAELALGITPVNYSYPAMYVDRYATNTSPRTTDMTLAFQHAIDVCKQGGGVIRWGATAPYLITSTLNCTFGSSANQFGLKFRDEGSTSQDGYPPGPSIIFQHTGYGFDLTGCDAYTFYDCTISTDATTFPQVCFFQARANVAGSNSQFPRIINTKVVGKFSRCIQYNYGSEDGLYVGNYWANTYTGAGKVVVITANNIFGLTSSFVTIRTGAQSCLDHEYFGGQFLMASSDAAADVFYFDAAGHIKIFGPWVSVENGAGVGGRAIFYVDMTNGATGHVHLSGVETENLTTQNLYGITFSNVAGTPSQWRIDDCYFPALTNAIFAPALVVLDSFFITQIKQLSGTGVACTTMQNSHCEMGAVPITISGTSTSNFIIGSNTITIGTRTKTTTIDSNTGDIRTNGVLGISNQPPAALVSGFGVPTGAGVIANFPGGGPATLAQCSTTIAEILTILKNVGFIGA